MPKYNWNNIEISEEEWQTVLQKQTFRHLVFCFCKYHRSDLADVLKIVSTEHELNKFYTLISKSENEKCEILNQSIIEIEKCYKHLYYQLAGIRKNFNVIGLDLNQIDNDTIYFWYELLLRIYLRS